MNDPLSDISRLASLLADPGRARMLLALMNGRLLPASDLALAAGLSAQAASNHLAKLLDGGVLRVEQRGRYRYYTLADASYAHAIEALSAAAHGHDRLRPGSISKGNAAIRRARSCYDHLAGRLGVAVCDALQARGLLQRLDSRQLTPTPAGEAWFREQLDIDCHALPSRRPLARACLDWSERRDHLAGALGAALCERLLARELCQRLPNSRALRITASGEHFLQQQLGICTARLDTEDGN